MVSLTLQHLRPRQTRLRCPLNKMGVLPTVGLDVLFNISFYRLMRCQWAKHRLIRINKWLGLGTGVWKHDPCILMIRLTKLRRGSCLIQQYRSCKAKYSWYSNSMTYVTLKLRKFDFTYSFAGRCKLITIGETYFSSGRK
jgi:hypothetical protein